MREPYTDNKGVKFNHRRSDCVRKQISKGNTFVGFIVGEKIHPNHYFDGWHLAGKVVIDTVEEFDTVVNTYNYYNIHNYGRPLFFESEGK